MEKTNSYTYFGIESNGKIGRNGLVAYKEGIFNPEDITFLLGIQPFNSGAYGSKRRGGSIRRFSTWDAEKSDVD